METYSIDGFFRTVLIRQTDVQQLKLLNITVIKSTVPPDHFSGSKVERVVQLYEDECEHAQECVCVCFLSVSHGAGEDKLMRSNRHKTMCNSVETRNFFDVARVKH